MKKSILVLVAFVAVIAISCGRSTTKNVEVNNDTTTVALDSAATSVIDTVTVME